jgi:hypothetical protein
LGRGRLGRRTVDCVREGCAGNRHRLCLRVERGHPRKSADSRRAGLPSAACARNPASDRCCDSRGRLDHGCAAGRADPGGGLGGHDCAGPCVPGRSSLGLARGGCARRESAESSALSPCKDGRLAPYSRSDCRWNLAASCKELAGVFSRRSQGLATRPGCSSPQIHQPAGHGEQRHCQACEQEDDDAGETEVAA